MNVFGFWQVHMLLRPSLKKHTIYNFLSFFILFLCKGSKQNNQGYTIKMKKCQHKERTGCCTTRCRIQNKIWYCYNNPHNELSNLCHGQIFCRFDFCFGTDSFDKKAGFFCFGLLLVVVVGCCCIFCFQQAMNAKQVVVVCQNIICMRQKN